MSAPIEQQKTVIPDRARLKTAYQTLRPAYEAALQKQYQNIRSLLENHGYTPTIKYRLKRFEAYYEKLVRTNRRRGRKELEPVMDLLGLRIICPFLEDVENIEKLISDRFEVLETESKGANHSFREFGYDSVHLMIRLAPGTLETLLPGSRRVCEVQLRTILQDAWAEVEHELVYKSDINLPNESIRRKLASLNATLTLSDLIFQEIRDFQKEIRMRGRKRRASLEGKWEISDQIAISHSSGASSGRVANLGAVPAPLASSLEKTMLSALEAHSNNNLETAIGLYGQLLGMKLNKKIRALVYNHRGMANFAMGNYALAQRDFSRAVLHDEENYRGFANRGLCHRVMGKYERSLEDFDRALEIAPSHVEGYFGRAQTFFDMKLYSRALSECEKVLEIQPGHRAAQELIKCIRREIF